MEEYCIFDCAILLMDFLFNLDDRYINYSRDKKELI